MYENNFDISFYFPSELNDTHTINFLNNLKYNPFNNNCEYNYFKNGEKLKELSGKSNNSKFSEKDKVNPCNITVHIYDSLQNFEESMENGKILTNTEQFYVKFVTSTEYILYSSVSKPLYMFIEFKSKNKNTVNNQFNFAATQVQAIIDKAIISTLDSSSPQYSLFLESIQIPNNSTSIEYERSILSKISLFMIYLFICNFCVLYSYLVQDHESNFVEKLKHKGVRESTLWISWAIVYGILIIVNSLIATVFFEVHYITDLYSFIVYFPLTFVYGMSCCSLAFILYNFINDHKTSITISKHVILTFLGLYYLYYHINKESNNFIVSLGSYLLFPFSFINLLNGFQTLQEKKISLSVENIVNNNDTNQCIIQFLISSLLVCVIALYLIINKKNTDSIHHHESTSVTKIDKDNKLTWKDIFDDDNQKKNANQNSQSIQTVNFNNASFISQIITVMKLKFSSFLNNEKHFVLNVLIPVCVISLLLLYFKFIFKQVFDNNSYIPVDINIDLYPNKNWFKDSSSTSETTLNIIDLIGNNISLESIDYSNRNIENISNDIGMNYIAGFKSENINSITHLKIYGNTSFFYSLPLAVNVLDNTILKHLNINKEIKVTYQPFEKQIFNEYIDTEDKNHWIKIDYEITKIVFITIILSVIFIYISYYVLTFGILTITDKKSNSTSTLFDKGLKPLNYWIGTLISDTLYMMIPTLSIIKMGEIIFENSGPFDHQNTELLICLSLLWIIQNLLYHYILCSYFKNHYIISRIIFLISGIITLCVSLEFNIFSVISLGNNNRFNIDSLLELAKRYESSNGVVLLKFIITSILSPSIGMISILPNWFLNTIKKMVLFQKIDVDHFLNLQNTKEILDQDMLLVDKKAQITKTFFFERKITSLKDIAIIKILLLGTICTISIYIIVHYFIEKQTLKNKKKEKKEK